MGSFSPVSPARGVGSGMQMTCMIICPENNHSAIKRLTGIHLFIYLAKNWLNEYSKAIMSISTLQRELSFTVIGWTFLYDSCSILGPLSVTGPQNCPESSSQHPAHAAFTHFICLGPILISTPNHSSTPWPLSWIIRGSGWSLPLWIGQTIQEHVTSWVAFTLADAPCVFWRFNIPFSH